MATRGKGTRSNVSDKPATRTTRSAAARAPTMAQAAPAKATIPTKLTKSTRKPLVERDNVASIQPKTAKSKSMKEYSTVRDDQRELIKAYLRIRPNLGDEQFSSPYIESLSSTTVQMSDPAGQSRFRLHPQVQVYTFDHVFPPETKQSDFYTNTTLPLVRDLLSGQNGLVFTYGVTNSGKTYTIQGGSAPGSAGLLPRTLDTVFNSLEGLHSDAPYRPVRVAGIERIPDEELEQQELHMPTEEKAIADALGERTTHERDETTIKVDRNYEYAIWVSYAEVYNEKVYDLLANDEDNNESGTPVAATGYTSGFARLNAQSQKKLPRSTSTWQSLATLAASTSSNATDVLLVKRKALVLKNDAESGGKYAAGLRRVRVRSVEEAQRVLRAGNIHRRVFGTLANAVSSRSHGIFTLTCVRIHRGERVRNGGRIDEDGVLISRLSIVDLAGSERTKNTQNTGDRLKEAGSINKSLMVLGQCMEALRTNQRRMASTLAAPGRGILDSGSGIPTLKRKPNLTLVPFRHSKLTELFQDFFASSTGSREGSVAMIVNVNPYDTGFDENSHVMRFAAVAREVLAAPTPPQVQAPRPKTPTKAVGKAKTGLNVTIKPTEKPANHRRVTLTTISNNGKGRKISEAQYEIVEEDEDQNSSDENDEFSDPLVDSLFDELEDLRIRLYESEMRCAVIEAETREEVMHEMEERMLHMERVFAKRLKNEVEQNEMKTDAKIDMLHQFGAFAGTKSPQKPRAKQSKYTTPPRQQRPEIEEDEKHSSDEKEDEGTEYIDIDEDEDDLEEEEEESDSRSPSPSPSQQRVVCGLTKAEKKSFQGGPPCIGLREEDMTIDDVDADETMTHASDEEDSEDENSEEEEEEEEEEEDDDYEDDGSGDEWSNSREGTPSTTASFIEANTPKPVKKLKPVVVVPRLTDQKKPGIGRTTLKEAVELHKQMNKLTIDDDEVEEIFAPVKGKRQSKSTIVGESSNTSKPPIRRSTRGRN